MEKNLLTYWCCYRSKPKKSLIKIKLKIQCNLNIWSKRRVDKNYRISHVKWWELMRYSCVPQSFGGYVDFKFFGLRLDKMCAAYSVNTHSQITALKPKLRETMGCVTETQIKLYSINIEANENACLCSILSDPFRLNTLSLSHAHTHIHIRTFCISFIFTLIFIN